MDTTQDKIRSECWKAGYRIYPKCINQWQYIIVIAKATKCQWREIPADHRKDYENVDGVVYRLTFGTEKYKPEPKGKDARWWDKVEELYRDIYYNKIINRKENKAA